MDQLNHDKQTGMNKELVLREYLAIERTKLANERTLLTYIRTSLYFVVAGATVGHLINSTFWKVMGIPLIVFGLVIIVIGTRRFMKVRKAINESKTYVGEMSQEFIRKIKEEED